METKIVIPEGYEIDKEKSTFECIKFKKLNNVNNKEPWRALRHKNIVEGFWINCDAQIIHRKGVNYWENEYNLFATPYLAQAALALARISQIIENDKRFGGFVTDEEWDKSHKSTYVYAIFYNHHLEKFEVIDSKGYHFGQFAFHTSKQAELFIQENKYLLKDYFMIP